MEQTDKQQMYFGGIPTGPDVARIEAVVEPTPGSIISHHTIEEAIDEKHGTSRYRTVTEAWRTKALRDYNIEIEAERGVGFRVLTEPERVGVMRKRVGGGCRKIGKAVNRGSRIDTRQLEGADKVTHEAQMRFGHALNDAAKRTQQAIRVEVRANKLLARPALDK